MPWLRTVALSVMRSPVVGALSLTVGVSTTRSGVWAMPVLALATLDAGPLPSELMAETR